MAPECFSLKKSENPRTVDVFAFGIMMWQCFSLKNPYSDVYSIDSYQNVVKLQEKISLSNLRPNLDLLENCSDEYIDLMKQCWNGDARERPQDFNTIIKRLIQIKETMVE